MILQTNSYHVLQNHCYLVPRNKPQAAKEKNTVNKFYYMIYITELWVQLYLLL